MKYTVNWPLEHDGKTYNKGDTIDLDKKVGAPLVELGNLTPPGGADKSDNPAPAV
jgi:hypothetical protein